MVTKLSQNTDKKISQACKFLMKKYNINKKLVLGHSDIAPLRKIDPGEKFLGIICHQKELAFIQKKY